MDIIPGTDMPDPHEFTHHHLDCSNLDELTEKWIDPDRPSFVTVLLRFFGNIFVDCFRAVFS